jgi:hypothetical protein
MYGGGMGEIGPGRAQHQYLASLFHPDTPNDLAPVAYNEAQLASDPPASPLLVPAPETGFTPGRGSRPSWASTTDAHRYPGR